MTQLTVSQGELQEIKHHRKWYRVIVQSRHYTQQRCLMMVEDTHLLKTPNDPQVHR